MLTTVYVIGNTLERYERFYRIFRSLAQTVYFRQGESIRTMGDYFSGFYLPFSGSVEIRYTNQNGQSKLLQLHNGPFVIGASCIDGYQNMLDYKCLTPVEAAYLPKEAFRQWDCEMLLDFAKIQTDKKRALSQQIQDARYCPREQRVLRVLWEYLLSTDPAPVLPARVSGLKKQTVADLLGITNVQLSSILRQLEHKGYLLTNPGKPGITVLRPYAGDGGGCDE